MLIPSMIQNKDKIIHKPFNQSDQLVQGDNIGMCDGIALKWLKSEGKEEKVLFDMLNVKEHREANLAMCEAFRQLAQNNNYYKAMGCAGGYEFTWNDLDRKSTTGLALNKFVNDHQCTKGLVLYGYDKGQPGHAIGFKINESEVSVFDPNNGTYAAKQPSLLGPLIDYIRDLTRSDEASGQNESVRIFCSPCISEHAITGDEINNVSGYIKSRYKNPNEEYIH